MLSNITDRILERLDSSDVQKLGSRWGLNDKLIDLKISISSIKTILAEAEEQKLHFNGIKSWLMNLERPICEADDLMDDFSAEALQQRMMGESEEKKGLIAESEQNKTRLIAESEQNKTRLIAESEQNKTSRIFSLRKSDNKVPNFPSASRYFFRLKVIRKIKKIENKLARAKHMYFKLESQKVEQVVVKTRSRDHILLLGYQEEIIGREEDKMEILRLLLNANNTEENMGVIPIVGTGGVGKTALAKLVFNDGMVRKHFELKIWVYVSDLFNLRLILEKIITCVTNNKSQQGLEMYELQDLFRKEINGKRYLLVLDDMWNDLNFVRVLDGQVVNNLVLLSEQEKWVGLKNLLVTGGWGSKVIITSCNHEVEQITGSLPPYHLKILDQKQSWTLFKRKAVSLFDQREEVKNSNIEKLGKDIAERCGGLPLVIRTIGSNLFYKDPEKEWPSFAEKVLIKSHQKDNAITTPSIRKETQTEKKDKVSEEQEGTEKEHDDNEEGVTEETEKEKKDNVLQLLKLCCDCLPQHLKPCFAFCRLFPKHQVIDVRTLVNLWLAQGFIKPSYSDEYLEDVGYEYFMDLLRRSFFQVVDANEKESKVTKCRMHRFMHDLTVLVAGVECIIADSNVGNFNPRRTHHLSFDFNFDSPTQILNVLIQGRSIEVEGIKKVQKVRLPTRTKTLLLPGQEWWWKIPTSEENKESRRTTKELDKTTLFVTIALSLKFLLVLDLHGLGIMMVPSSIGELKYLRFLDLSRNYGIQLLPNSLCKLHYLQTLKLNRCENLQELPRDIGQLVSLRHLEIDGCYNLSHMPRGLSQLTDLQTLSQFVLSKGTTYYISKHAAKLDELKGLKNLRGELEIKNLRSEIDFKVGMLKEKQHLQSLMLYWEEDNVDAKEDGDYEVTLKTLQPHSNLMGLTLYGYGGVRFSACWLSSLANLVRLRLHGCLKLQYLTQLNLFLSLKELVLNKLPALEFLFDLCDYGDFLSSSSTLFPSLQHLQLCNLPNLKGWWRDGLEHENLEGATTSRRQPFFGCIFELVVNNCPKLASLLPDGLESFNSLQRLEIRDCHILYQQYQKDIGDLWPLIAHVPKVVLY